MANGNERLNKMVPVNATYLAHLQQKATLASAKIRETAVAHAGTAKVAGMSAGVGALIGFFATLDDVKNQKFVKENWWILPLAVLALGYYLQRKNNPHGKSILAAGGVLMMNAYQNRPKGGTATQGATKPTSDTAGPWDNSMLHPGVDGHAWLQAPDGQWVRVQLQPMLRQFGPMLSTMAPAAQPTAVRAPAPAAAVETSSPTDFMPDDPAARLAAAAFAT